MALMSCDVFLSGYKEKEAYLTRMLILVCIVYLILSLPLRLYILAMTGRINPCEDREGFVVYTAMVWFCAMCWYLNYAVNFLMYCIGGGTRFRQDVKAVFRCAMKEQKGVNSFSTTN
jgi:hypothetical protein